MRRIIAALLPLLIAAPLLGQTTLGFRAGLSRATASSNAGGVIDQDPRRGVVAGVDVGIPLGSAIELRVGGAYSQKGSGPSVAAFTSGDILFSGTAGIEADYLQLSTLARIGAPRDGGMSVGLLLGPWAASLLSCNAILNLDFGKQGWSNVSEPCDDTTKSTDFGVAAGAVVEMAISDGLRLAVDLIYSLGLANIDDTSMEEIKTRHLAVQAGFVIPLGG